MNTHSLKFEIPFPAEKYSKELIQKYDCIFLKDILGTTLLHINKLFESNDFLGGCFACYKLSNSILKTDYSYDRIEKDFLCYIDNGIMDKKIKELYSEILVMYKLNINDTYNKINKPTKKSQDNKNNKILFLKNKSSSRTIIISLIIAILLFSIPIISSINQNKTTPKNEVSTVMVYITRTGSKYHRNHCSYLRSSKIEISLENAVEESYSPCSRCNPPKTE